jgi:hypothetical protein
MKHAVGSSELPGQEVHTPWRELRFGEARPSRIHAR